jgi:hypothetical protein
MTPLAAACPVGDRKRSLKRDEEMQETGCEAHRLQVGDARAVGGLQRLQLRALLRQRVALARQRLQLGRALLQGCVVCAGGGLRTRQLLLQGCRCSLGRVLHVRQPLLQRIFGGMQPRCTAQLLLHALHLSL